MLVIDGSLGEGGGQILRTTLALAMVTGEPVRIVRIRQSRRRPGLQRQHLTAVHAAARLSHARLTGDQLHSTELEFAPQAVVPGEYVFRIGTAGSCALVLQTLLPALFCAAGPSQLTIEGGTHNPLAPPFEFLERAYLPLVERMGPRVAIQLERHGFFPRGGGRISVSITPAEKLDGLELPERGPIQSVAARALVADLPLQIAERELDTIARELNWEASRLTASQLPPGQGPGNVVLLEIAARHVTEVFAGFGQKGLPAEKVARRVAAEARNYLDHDVAVGEYLSDQLLLPLALAGAGTFTTFSPLSSHAQTHLELLRRFLNVSIVAREEEGRCRVTLGGSR